MARRKNVRIPARVGLSGHDADASARGNIMIALMLIRTRGYGLKWLISKYLSSLRFECTTTKYF